MQKDYYQILGVDKSATAQEISKAFRKLAKKYHPDLNHEAGAEQKYKDVNEAYEILHDPKKRQKYDAESMNFGTGFGNFSNSDYNDYNFNSSTFDNFNFDDFMRKNNMHTDGNTNFDNFGDVFNQYTNDVQKGDDLDYTMNITFKDSISGITKRIKYQRKEMCTTCQGLGFVNGVKCETCQGKGVVDHENMLEINVPKGIDSGQKLRYEGQGNCGSYGGTYGDLYITYQIEPDKYFKRKGKNLYTTITVSILDALLGATVKVRTIKGLRKMQIPAGTQPNDQFALSGGGMPIMNTDKHGDQIIKINVAIPTKLTDNEKESLRDFNNVNNVLSRK